MHLSDVHLSHQSTIASVTVLDSDVTSSSSSFSLVTYLLNSQSHFESRVRSIGER